MPRPATEALRAAVAALMDESAAAEAQAEELAASQKRRVRTQAKKLAEEADVLASLDELLDAVDDALEEGTSLAPPGSPLGVAVAAWAGKHGYQRALPAMSTAAGDVFIAPEGKAPRDDEPLYLALEDPEPSRGSAAHIVCAAFRHGAAAVERVTVNKTDVAPQPTVVAYHVLRVDLA